jgi:hypothetical protein
MLSDLNLIPKLVFKNFIGSKKNDPGFTSYISKAKHAHKSPIKHIYGKNWGHF